MRKLERKRARGDSQRSSENPPRTLDGADVAGAVSVYGGAMREPVPQCSRCPLSCAPHSPAPSRHYPPGSSPLETD